MLPQWNWRWGQVQDLWRPGRSARNVLHHWEGFRVVERGEDGGVKLTPQRWGELDRIAGQVATAIKKHYK
uniref:Uncharacterized protein n=1 Tax=Apteryx owenii TaxID=8824 RepID=A0A8B9PW99_APTOW